MMSMYCFQKLFRELGDYVLKPTTIAFDKLYFKKALNNTIG